MHPPSSSDLALHAFLTPSNHSKACLYLFYLPHQTCTLNKSVAPHSIAPYVQCTSKPCALILSVILSLIPTLCPTHSSIHSVLVCVSHLSSYISFPEFSTIFFHLIKHTPTQHHGTPVLRCTGLSSQPLLWTFGENHYTYRKHDRLISSTCVISGNLLNSKQ